MKNAVILLLATFLFLQKGRAQARYDYQKSWNSVQALEQRGLYQSAWSEAKKIYTEAAERHDVPQQLKALIYQFKYRDKITEGSVVSNMRRLDSLAGNANGIQKALLQSMLAEAYKNYASANRYRLYERITSTAEDEDDVSTWSLAHLYQRIDTLFGASVAPEAALGKISLKDLRVIVDTGTGLRREPTLYDLLARRALDYYTSDVQQVTHAADQYAIHEPGAFSPAGVFTNVDLPEHDSGSQILKALRLYQRLLLFHLHDEDPAALLDVDLARLQFVYRKAVMADKDSLYRGALEQMISLPVAKTLTSGASFALASWYFSRGSLYDPLTHPRNRLDLKKALEICEGVATTPVSEGSTLARHLRATILRPDLSLSAEQVNIPQTPFRMLVSYKNLHQVWLRLVKLPEDATTVFARQNHQDSVLLSRPALRQWTQLLPDPEDHQDHSAEMKIGSLPHGRYALIASGDSSFAHGTTPVVSTVFFVSSISYVYNGKGDYLVVDRETGKPLEGAVVRLWRTVYDAASRKNRLALDKSLKTDGDGRFSLDSPREGRSLLPEISWKGDHLFTAQGQYIPMVRSTDEKKDTSAENTFLFTDRSIYRPGQTLYFKGICLREDLLTHQSRVVPHKTATIYLIDANGQKLDSLRAGGNDFGSYRGSFVLPAGLLNGSMSLRTADQKGNAYFSVEDYKRPNFYLSWDTSRTAYRIGDLVPVSGRVSAFSQAPASGAGIVYQVTRTARFRIYGYAGRRYVPRAPQMATVAQGVTTTDSLGKFNFRFTALPDESADSTMNPQFEYHISVTVTNISGESHEFTKQIPLGYRNLDLNLEVPDKIAVGDLDTLRLASTDLSGNFVSAAVRVDFVPLEAPRRYIRPRYWHEPDQYLMGKKQFLALFPHDPYQSEADPATWKKGPAVWTTRVETNPGGKIALGAHKLPPGWYLIRALADDPAGGTDSALRYVQCYQPAGPNPAGTAPLWVSTNEVSAVPGQQPYWFLASGPNVFITRQDERLEHRDDPVSMTLRDETKKEVLSVRESDRGGVIRHYVSVRYNRVFTQDVRISVPWDNKRLHIRYETFRNKLLPGSKETWSVRINGPDGARVTAELLASMYDASLDAFTPHRWPDPGLYPSLSPKISWSGSQTFSQAASGILFYPKTVDFPEYNRVDPMLNWFGYRPGGYQYPIYRYNSRAPAPLDYNTAVTAMKKNTVAFDVEEKGSGIQAADSAGGLSDAGNTPPATVRKNFNETAFFLPQLHTDDSGRVVFSFTMPEALTRWKMMLFAHTRDMQYAYSEKEVVTQKQLMIQANAPRFVRQGDRLILTAKISNLTTGDLSGQAELKLSDLETGKPVDTLFQNSRTVQSFLANAGQGTAVQWTIVVPRNYRGVLSYTLTATAGNVGDGEQDALPVLSNRTLVTETLPLFYTGNGTHHERWDILKQMNASSTLLPEALTVEYTSNPVWYAVLALPVIDEDQRPSTDALYDRFYANALGKLITGSIPHFKEVLQAWTSEDTSALTSPLDKNQELKSVLLQETPWVRNAQEESTQRAKTAGWFNEKQVENRLRETIGKLKALQLSNGGFPWFKGMPDDPRITSEILTGIGHLAHLGGWPTGDSLALEAILKKAIPYLDARMMDAYRERRTTGAPKDPKLGARDIRYLYMRSFFSDFPKADSVQTAFAYYMRLASRDWMDQRPYDQIMLATALYRAGRQNTAVAILKSMSETSIRDQVKGIHWKAVASHGPLNPTAGETQALAIEAYHEITGNQRMVSGLCTWLLAQKRVQSWPTKRATAEAVYALLLAGNSWTQKTPKVAIRLGDQTLPFDKNGAGAGYQKTTISGPGIKPAMSHVSVALSDAAHDQPSWGALYFQYFQDMDKLKKSDTHLTVARRISLEKNTDAGPVLSPVSEGQALKVGDKVQVRLILKTDQDLDYVHLKDVRASCMEPLQVLSGYQWQGGTGYYSTVTDAAVHFYFPHLSRGTYVFTYPVFITQAGHFTGGMSTLECLYAPEFTAHSGGVDLQVGNR